MGRRVVLLVAVGATAVGTAGVAMGTVQPSGSILRISTTGTDGDLSRDPFTPAVAYNPAANNYLVVWESDHLANDQFEVHGQLVSANGTEIGTDFRISNATDVATVRDAFDPAVAYDSDDNEFLVTFTADGLPAATDDQFEIFGQRVSAAGAPDAQGDFRISNASDVDASRDAGSGAVTYDATLNQFLVVWSGDQVPAEDDQSEIHGQLVNANGTEDGSDFRISEMNTDASRDALAPDLAFNSTGNEYLVTWTGDGLPGASDEQFETFGQLISAAGVPDAQDDFRISNASDSGTNRDVCIVQFGFVCGSSVAYSSAADEFLVAWHSDQLADEQFEVFGQRVSIAGVADPQGDFRISNAVDVGASRDAVLPDVEYDPAANQYLAVWQADTGTTDDNNDAVAQVLSPAGAEIGPEFSVTPFGSDNNAFTTLFEVVVAHNSVAGSSLVVWEGTGAVPASNEREVAGRLVADITVTSPTPPSVPKATPSVTPSPPLAQQCTKKKKKRSAAAAKKKKTKGCKKKKRRKKK